MFISLPDHTSDWRPKAYTHDREHVIWTTILVYYVTLLHCKSTVRIWSAKSGTEIEFSNL